MYILSIDQSTQGTKALLFDETGEMVARADHPHRQIITKEGWVEHDLKEILCNVYQVCREVVEKAGVSPAKVKAVGISNQRETTAAWDRKTGEPACHAIVWQCTRAEEIARNLKEYGNKIQKSTGLPLSPYFSAAKMAWMTENVERVKELLREERLCFGTIDSWLLFHLTEEHVHATDYSNASRTQLFSLEKLEWDEEICGLFGIPLKTLPQVRMSDSCFGYTTLDGFLPEPVPICGVLGDSHGALFGQNCRKRGQLKATYGTGSSVMVNTGEKPIFSEKGIVTSIAWGRSGKVSYVLEGNLNYTGAVISWLKDEVQMITSAAETEALARQANPSDTCYLVPAFTGLGAPYWKPSVRGMLTGISRTTGKNEIVRAGLDCIAYQITDLLHLMQEEMGYPLEEMKADGGPAQNAYLMQFQSDMAGIKVSLPPVQELSGMGAAFLAGISCGLYQEEIIFGKIVYNKYVPKMERQEAESRYGGWQQAVKQACSCEKQQS